MSTESSSENSSDPKVQENTAASSDAVPSQAEEPKRSDQAEKPQPNTDETASKTALERELSELRGLHRTEGEIPKKIRKKLLKKLKKVVIASRQEFVTTVAEDFRGRSSYETLAAEVMLICSAIRHTIRHLDDWTEIEEREVSLTFWPASMYLRPQALGVVGVVSPWNYPIQLALLPIVQAISAGNRVMLKPSEHTPKTSALLAKILHETIGKEYIRVCEGGVDVGVEFAGLPFDHLFFTGAPEIGKKVMAAASKHLTPVTLELGGKSPALIHSSFSIGTAASRIATGKFLNAGQTCIAPDYILCPKDKVSSLVEELSKKISKMYDSLKDNDDYTAIINDRQYERLHALLADAKEKGAKLTVCNPKNEDLKHKIAPHILEGVSDEMLVMQEEIFGPILPIVGYETMDEAINFINDRPRPLALYYFDHKGKRIRELLAKTHSGGVCINDTLLQVSQDDLPFGGIGYSGIGSYHGKTGFDTFSHHKPVYHQSRFSLVPHLTRPPYPKWVRAFVRFLIGW